MTNKFMLVYFCTNKIESMRLAIRDAKDILMGGINEIWKEREVEPEIHWAI